MNSLRKHPHFRNFKNEFCKVIRNHASFSPARKTRSVSLLALLQGRNHARSSSKRISPSSSQNSKNKSQKWICFHSPLQLSSNHLIERTFLFLCPLLFLLALLFPPLLLLFPVILSVHLVVFAPIPCVSHPSKQKFILSLLSARGPPF